MASTLDGATKIIDIHAKRHTTRAPMRGRACLIQYNGEALGRRFLLDAPEITLGRRPEADVFVSDESVSLEHARFFTNGDRVEIEDLGSHNGTFIHHQKVSARTLLTDGAILRLGAILFKFFAKDNIESAFHDKIYQLATVDAGTQLFNKKYLLETLDSEFRLSRVYGRPLSVVYYDLDFFKKVNDTLGHNCGDYVLRECSNVAKACMRTEDMLARFGGEEFVAILPDANRHLATEVAERIRQAVANHQFVFEGKALAQTISLGVSENQPLFKTAADLLDDADRKLYQSKHLGRNRVTA